jgi:hypothetical protein
MDKVETSTERPDELAGLGLDNSDAGAVDQHKDAWSGVGSADHA